jgi:signal transduction histidine kinase
MSANFNIIENFILRHVKLSVILIYNLLIFLIELICWRLVPFLLSYPSNFNEVSNKIGTSTILQYVIIQIACIVISTIVFNRLLRDVGGWWDLSKENQEDTQKIKEIRKKCIDLPNKIFWGQIIAFNIPVAVLMIIMSILNKGSLILSAKIIILGILLSSTVSVILFTVYKRIFKRILLKTFIASSNEGKRHSIKKIIFIQVIPLIVISMFVIAFVGYSRLIDAKDNYIYAIYKTQIQYLPIKDLSFKDTNDIMKFLSVLNYTNTKPFYFIQSSNGKIVTSNNSKLSLYLSYYIDNPFDGDRIFDINMETQGIVFQLPTEKEGTIRAGVIFHVASESTINYFIISFFILLALNTFTLYHVSKTLSDDISEVTEGLIEIIENENADQNKRLFVSSNDEISDLVIAFNKIRERQLEYDKLKTEFIANISHELRTPLNVIFAATQLSELYIKNGFTIDKDIEIEKIDKNIKIVKQNCRRLLRLINNLIDVTKIEAGFSQLNLQPLNIINIIETITLSIEEYAKTKGIRLQFETDIQKKVMYCDPDKIERIILNLLSNAIKFTNTNGDIYVTIHQRGKKILISVKDSGIGIPENKHEIIFERFRQVEQSLSRNHEGSGIGLSLVKSFVEMHEGKIYVKSMEGIGSEFIIELPVEEIPMNVYEHTNYEHLACSKENVERIKVEFSDIYSQY